MKDVSVIDILILLAILAALAAVIIPGILNLLGG